jgi:Domain of unknown function (DUF6968)
MTYELGDIILERDFELLDAKGNSGTVKLFIGKPYQVTESEWRCPYQIAGITSETVRAAPGRDSIDAVLTSLQIAEVFLKSYRDKKITWQGDEELCLHFPSLEEISEPDKLTSDDNSPFKKVFDEFFRNFDRELKDKPSSTPKQSGQIDSQT